MSYVKVFSGSVVEVQRIRGFLQEKGVEPIIKDNTSSAMMAGFGAIMPDYQELFIREDEQSVVLDLIDKM